MAEENTSWGAPRIHGELLKLGFDVSERTVARYMPKKRPTEAQLKKWKAFLHNHRDGIAAMDFFTVPTLSFQILYVFFIIDHGRRKIIHFNVTAHPSADWVVQQLREAFPFNQAPKHLIFDRDSIFSARVVRVIKSFGTKTKRTNYKSPWQNGKVERWVKNCRNELLNHVIVFNERHLHQLLRKYVDYYNLDRCHYNLNKDSPTSRPVQCKPSESARVVALLRVSGLHHRYEWRDAA